MYKIILENKKEYTNPKWTELDNSPIEKIEYYLNDKEKIVFSGFEKYIVLEENQTILGISSQQINHMSVLGKYKNKCYQLTQNLIWKTCQQRINSWGKEYTPMSFNWKQQKWTISVGRQLNPVMWHNGLIGKPKVELVK